MKLSKTLATCSIIATILCCAGCKSGVPERGAIIEGKVSGFPAEDTIVASLIHFEGVSGQEIMKDTLVGGCFSFRLDSLAGSNKYSLMLNKERPDGKFPYILCRGPELYLEPGARVRISGDGNYLYSARIDSPVREQKLRQRFIEKLPAEDLLARPQGDKQYCEGFQGSCRRPDVCACKSSGQHRQDTRGLWRRPAAPAAG